MSVTDPIADLLTRLRNAAQAQHRYVDISHSKIKQNIAEILKEMGLIEHYLVKLDKTKGLIRIFLKYSDRRSVIQGLKRVSKPGQRKYIGVTEIPHFFGGLGVSILSTSQGVMTGHEAAKRKIGGELLCLVW